MKDETIAIDLAKFEEARKTISSIQKQFFEMVLDKIEETSVFECTPMNYAHNNLSFEHYTSLLTVANIPVALHFIVRCLNDEVDLLPNFHWMNLKLTCSTLDISEKDIMPRKSVTVKLHFIGTDKKMLLQFKKSGEN